MSNNNIHVSIGQINMAIVSLQRLGAGHGLQAYYKAEIEDALNISLGESKENVEAMNQMVRDIAVQFDHLVENTMILLQNIRGDFEEWDERWAASFRENRDE